MIACFALVALAACSKSNPTSSTGSVPANSVAAPGSGQGQTQSPGQTIATSPGTPSEAKPSPAQVVPPRDPVTVAAGTPLEVRTTSTISSKTHAAGEMFTATLERPLTSGDRVLAPVNSRVEGVVSSVDPGGKVKGRATIAIRVTSLTTPDGRTIPCQTRSYGVQARGTKKKDALKVGIGAGVGAAIGAIAGGGKGAAIGAGAGGGAGTGVVLATRGEPAVIPAESRLRFTLTAPVSFP